MFITVMFGAGCQELVNIWCSLVTLNAHLRQRGQLPPDATIALLAEDGNLVSLEEGLEEGTSPAPSMGSSLLQERGTYVLVQVISKWATEGEGGAPTRYESLLENLDERYPELAGECLGCAWWEGENFSSGPLVQEDFPDLPEELRRLSGLPATGNGTQRRRMSTRHGGGGGGSRGQHREQGPNSRPRRTGSLPSRTR
ncbi:uncharacterized protein C22orf15 homolog isoform X1 [Ochotona curzoniae]|uniref:uncharacterized protein C22orf15 homolog isoform X1 n=1 Tax=Ochotona curzoniae TaxID=130825 RepID=UPI001B349C32|nr:uncharacterized protein C22orf15 homolog isoform X1 [Ochotona curzoniae]